MKKIDWILFVAFAMVCFSCSREENVVVPEEGDAPVIGFPDGATRGELIVKFKPETAPRLDRMAASSTQGAVTRSGVGAVDSLLDRVGGCAVERVFPVDSRNEQRTRKSGLSLWYVVRFDKNTDLRRLAKDLSKISAVAKVQYNRPVQRAYDPNVRPVVVGHEVKAKLQAVARLAGERPLFNDPALPLQWGYVNDGSVLRAGDLNGRNEEVVPAVAGADVGCGEAWKLCQGDPSVIVAVLDEGVMWNHPDLQANMWINEAETYASSEDADGNGYTGDRYGYNFVENRGFLSYDAPGNSGHGTHVAGTIAAVNGNGIGVCGVAGGDGTPNSGVKIMSCQVFAGTNGVSLYQEAQAIKYAADNGAVVLQCSWGYNSGLSNPQLYAPGFASDAAWADGCPLEKEALDYFIHNAGSPNGVIDGGIAVFAGGNENSAMAGYPGGYPDYISVAAVAADGTPACYTNYAKGIRIAAPGGDGDYHKSGKGKILSTIPPFEGEYYGYMEGTSMACPHVSGCVALGLSYAAKLHRHFRADEFRNMVLSSAHELEPYFNGTKVYWVNYLDFGAVSPMQMESAEYAGRMGSGLIDAGLLLKAVENGGVEMTVPNIYLSLGETVRINYSKYFNRGEQMTFSCKVEDVSVVSANSTDQVTFVWQGLEVGSTKATVTASDGTRKDFYVTVRKNGSWL